MSLRLSRRDLLKIGGLGLATSLLGQKADAAALFGRMFAVPPRDTTYFTPNDKFYVVNYSDSPFSLSRDVRIDQWRLSITGAVKLPMALSYGDILQRPAIDRAVTLECIDNLPGGDSMGNAMWRGLSLKALLEEVGADKEMARDVVFRAADGYDDSIPFERAMDGDVLLAYMMNGVTLPKMHGFPLRAVVPGLYGIKNVKWITQLEVYEGDYKGYWQRKGWTDDGTIKLTSRIDSPGHYQILRGKEHLFKGIAFGGPETIKKVEISFDSGRTWKDAPFELPLSPYTWVIWYYNWAPPKAGSYQVAVRAIDTKGLVHGALGLLRFGKGDHMRVGVGPAKKHNQTVQAKRDAAVRRGAVLKGVQQKAEFGLRFVLADPKQIKELALNLPAVVADAAPADFGPVQDEIVGLGARLQRLGFELRHVLIQRRGEGMMQRDVALLRFVVLQQGKVRHPERPPGRLVDQV